MTQSKSRETRTGRNPRSGQLRQLADAKVEAVITRLLETRPEHATHWSTRTRAGAGGLYPNDIVRCQAQPRQQEFLRFPDQSERTAAIEDHTAANKRNSKPLVRSATAELILDRVVMLCKRTSRSPHQAKHSFAEMLRRILSLI
jgi:hypothetical protein